jgi:hypothetical protein
MPGGGWDIALVACHASLNPGCPNRRQKPIVCLSSRAYLRAGVRAWRVR